MILYTDLIVSVFCYLNKQEGEKMDKKKMSKLSLKNLMQEIESWEKITAVKKQNYINSKDNLKMYTSEYDRRIKT